jgi:hypothetical protein
LKLVQAQDEFVIQELKEVVDFRQGVKETLVVKVVL